MTRGLKRDMWTPEHDPSISTRSNHIWSIVYCSHRRPGLSDHDVSEIAIRANMRNMDRGVEGVLFIDDRRFFQILQGRQADVHTLYEQISRDDRHMELTKVLDAPIPRRHFVGWPMRLICDSDLTQNARNAMASSFAVIDQDSTDSEMPDLGALFEILMAIADGILGTGIHVPPLSTLAPEYKADGTEYPAPQNRLSTEIDGIVGIQEPTPRNTAKLAEGVDTPTVPGRRVLVVDEETLERQELANELIAFGFAPILVDNFERARAILAASPAEFALIDAHACGRAEATVVGMLRETQPDLRVVVVTRYGSVELAVAAVRAGAADYLPKPVAVQDVVDVLFPASHFVRKRPPRSPRRVRWEHIMAIFESTGGNISESARRLRMHRRSLQRVLKRGAPVPQVIK